MTNTSVDAVLNPKDTVKQWINDVANYDDALLSLYATSDIAADVLRDTATEAFDWATGSFPTDAPLPTHSVELNISANLPNLGIPSEGGTDFNFDAGALPNIDLSVPQSVLTQNTRVATTGYSFDGSATGGVLGYYDSAQGLDGYLLPGHVVNQGLRNLAVGAVAVGVLPAIISEPFVAAAALKARDAYAIYQSVPEGLRGNILRIAIQQALQNPIVGLPIEPVPIAPSVRPVQIQSP